MTFTKEQKRDIRKKATKKALIIPGETIIFVSIIFLVVSILLYMKGLEGNEATWLGLICFMTGLPILWFIIGFLGFYKDFKKEKKEEIEKAKEITRS